MSNLGPGKVLALDLSTETGWAFGRPGPGCPEWGFIELPKEESRAAVIARFEDWLDAAIDRLKPDAVVYEAPFGPQQQRDVLSCFYAYALAGATEACCFRAQVPFRSHSVETIRTAVLGRKTLTEDEKRMKPRVTVKTQIVAPWIKSQGWDISNHNSRDAAVVWAYATGYRHALFGKRRAA